MALTVEPTDAKELASVAAATFPLGCPPELSETVIDRFVANNLTAHHFALYLADTASHVFKAIDPVSGSITGYAVAVDGDPDDSNVSDMMPQRPLTAISRMYVLPDFQGTGTAADLLAATLVHARDRGSTGVWAGVNMQNTRAQQFYQKMGFDFAGHVQSEISGVATTSIIFARTPPP